MGGRMSGESPREAKVIVRNGRAGAVRPYHTEDAGDAVAPRAVGQAVWQQPIVRRPFEQHESWDAPECATAADWQSIDVRGDAAANAPMELCSPITRIAMKAANRLCMFQA
jgi:hypothetical protein